MSLFEHLYADGGIYEDVGVKLRTQAVVNEADGTVTIEATTSGFSVFAVGLGSDEIDAEDETVSDGADDAETDENRDDDVANDVDTDEGSANDAGDDVGTADSPNDDTDGVPGFGVVGSLLAVVIAALLTLHRNATAGSRSPPSFR